MIPFNLLTEHWIPVRRADGTRLRIPPWRIGDAGDGTPGQAIEDIDTPRPDFKGALLEFLVGLVQTASPPPNEQAWVDGFAAPPTPATLQHAFSPLLPFFNLFGQRPRFLQDLNLSEAETKEPWNVAALLLDSPGENATRFNSDIFLKRDQPPEKLCPACAATALMAMQAYAPSGGAGHRTSMRGGGPLTTLVVRDTLWETVWANVLPLDAPKVEAGPESPDGLPDAVFPWPAPTHESNAKGTELHREGMHFLHHYWGMPRRIVLLPTEEATPAVCPVCGSTGTVFVYSYLTKNYGNNYGMGWRHPLTPYRDQGPGKDALSLKGISEGRGYNQWLGLVYGEGDTEKFPVLPAACVRHYGKSSRKKDGTVVGRVRAFGYDMDNMKPRNWCEGEYPVYALGEHEAKDFQAEITPVVKAADLARRNLQSAVKEALFGEKGAKDIKPDASLIKQLEARFWAETEEAFYRLVPGVIRHMDDEEALFPDLVGWRNVITKTAETLFTQFVLDGGLLPRKAKRIYTVYNRMLAFNFAGCSKLLGIPLKKEANK